MDLENKFKIHLPFDLATPLLLTYIIEIRVLVRKDICTDMFIAALFLVAKHWKDKCLSFGKEWNMKEIMRHSHQGVLCSHLKKCFKAIYQISMEYCWENRANCRKDIKYNPVFVKQWLQNLYMYTYVYLKNMEGYVLVCKLGLSVGTKKKNLCKIMITFIHFYKIV